MPVPIHQQASIVEMQATGIIKPVDHATSWINCFVIVNKNSLTIMTNSNPTVSWTPST